MTLPDKAAEEAKDPNSQGIELVFGFVGPTGVDLGKVSDVLCNELKAVEYETTVISLSELISPYLNLPAEEFAGEYDRIKTLMDRGTQLRDSTQQPDIVARLGVAKIRATRKEVIGDENRPISRTAYVIRSFKRPEEVQLFREIYGTAFTLISVYSPRNARMEHLARRISSSGMPKDKNAEELAVQLVNRDYAEEGRDLGQRVGKTFPLADYFITAESKKEIEYHLRRLVRLTFGDPYVSPSRDEQAMFFAQAAALRSLDLSRQVGAAIVSMDGDVIATGCNEVPKFQGGLYWAGDEGCARDYDLGQDPNVAIKRDILEDAITRMRAKGWLADSLNGMTDRHLASVALFEKDPFLRDSQLFDVIEFGRAVHAEMAAIAEAARRGVAVHDARLFCTTFPCHICARHIVASGLREVVFIEPYEKSRTRELYSDSISVEPMEPSLKRVNFHAFVGAAPRRYMHFFQMMDERKTREGEVLGIDQIAANPKVKRIVFTYLSVEEMAVNQAARIQSSGDGS